MCPIKTLDYYFGAFAGNYVLFCVFLRKKKICVILCFFFFCLGYQITLKFFMFFFVEYSSTK